MLQPLEQAPGRSSSYLLAMMKRGGVQDLVARLQQYGRLFTVRHSHTLGGHTGAVPGVAASSGRHAGGPGIVVTSGFDGLTNIWRPSVRLHHFVLW